MQLVCVFERRRSIYTWNLVAVCRLRLRARIARKPRSACHWHWSIVTSSLAYVVCCIWTTNSWNCSSQQRLRLNRNQRRMSMRSKRMAWDRQRWALHATISGRYRDPLSYQLSAPNGFICGDTKCREFTKSIAVRIFSIFITHQASQSDFNIFLFRLCFRILPEIWVDSAGSSSRRHSHSQSVQPRGHRESIALSQ